LIEKQIGGSPDLNFDPSRGPVKAPGSPGDPTSGLME